MEITKMTAEEVTKDHSKISVCVMGLGRIGLPLASVLANSGYNVIGLDIKNEIVDQVNRGECRFKDEPCLAELLSSSVASNRLKATSDSESAISKSDVIIICVPTPVDRANHPDYSAAIGAAKAISKSIRKNTLVLVESTVGPGTVEGLIIPIIEESGLKAGKDFSIAATPERSNPGTIIKNMTNDFKIIGGIDELSTELATAFYSVINKKIVKVKNPKTANAVKLTENIYRNTNIALMNELSVLFEKLGIDAFEVIKACSTKWNFLPHYPGPGVGGPCLPANPYYLIDEAIKVNYVPYLVRLSNEVNTRMPSHVVELVSGALNSIGKTVKESQITIVGLGYKSDVADTQLTPAEPIVSELKKLGAKLKLFDPFFAGKTFLNLEIEKSIDDAVRNSDCLVFVADHTEFKNIDFSKIKNLINNSCCVVDCRGIFDPEKLNSLGISYFGIGRSNSFK